MTTPQQGWYDDPEDANGQRYWDGQEWTPHRQPKAASGFPPPPQAPPVAPPPPGAPPPQYQGVPYPGAGAGSGQSASVDLAVVRALLSNLSVTGWLLFGGLLASALTIFLPWVTISVMGMEEGSADVGPHLGFKYLALLAVVAAGWLAWPALSGIPVPANRLIGLASAVGVLILIVVIGFYSILSFSSKLSSEIGGLVQASPGFGLYLYAAAVIASAAGVVRVWMQQPKT